MRRHDVASIHRGVIALQGTRSLRRAWSARGLAEGGAATTGAKPLYLVRILLPRAAVPVVLRVVPAPLRAPVRQAATPEGIDAMTKRDAKARRGETSERQPYRVRMPGFVSDEDVGLGDAIKRVTYAFGLKPCGGCERRAAVLNRWLAFSRRRSG